MADLVQTPANVLAQAGAESIPGNAGEAILAGAPCYFKASDSKWYNSLSSGTAEQAGSGGLKICQNSAPGANQPIKLCGGTINLGATLVVGTEYVVSANSGKIAPRVDLISTNYISVLGVASTISLLLVPTAGAFVTGIQVP